MNILEMSAQRLRPVLNWPLIRRVRQNHGLEHATIHVLSRDRYRLSGRASLNGFILIGDVPTERVQAAAEEALRRMQRGEAHLAVHPNCGTNLLTSGFLVTLLSALAFTGTNRRAAWDRFPFALLGAIFAILYGPLLGNQLQQHFTTSGEPGNLEIYAVRRSESRLPLLGRMVVHTILTR